MYWYKPCALLSGGTAARADSIRPYSDVNTHKEHFRLHVDFLRKYRIIS